MSRVVYNHSDNEQKSYLLISAVSSLIVLTLVDILHPGGIADLLNIFPWPLGSIALVVKIGAVTTVMFTIFALLYRKIIWRIFKLPYFKYIPREIEGDWVGTISIGEAECPKSKRCPCPNECPNSNLVAFEERRVFATIKMDNRYLSINIDKRKKDSDEMTTSSELTSCTGIEFKDNGNIRFSGSYAMEGRGNYVKRVARTAGLQYFEYIPSPQKGGGGTLEGDFISEDGKTGHMRLTKNNR